MKLIIIDKNTGYQLASLKWNDDGIIAIGTIIEQYGEKFRITEFVDLQDTYITFKGVKHIS